jgi:uncharacterized membrane protein
LKYGLKQVWNMPYVEKSTEIYAPVEAVFQFIAHSPERMVDWWPPIELQERITPPPTTVGSMSRYVYNMLGIRIKGEHCVVDLVENRHLLVKTTSGIDTSFDFTFAPAENSTLLTVRVSYALPGAILGGLFNRAVIEKHNAEELEQGLVNLRKILHTAQV